MIDWLLGMFGNRIYVVRYGDRWAVRKGWDTFFARNWCETGRTYKSGVDGENVFLYCIFDDVFTARLLARKISETNMIVDTYPVKR